MSYVNKKERFFREGEPLDIPHSRSEARMKKYWSATDRRAWCDEVELRRQHILELNARNKGQFCLENFIPLDLLFNAMAANKEEEIAKLQQRVNYLEAMLDVYRQIELTPKQKLQVDDLNAKLAEERKKLKAAQDGRDRDGGPKPFGRRKKRRDDIRPEDNQHRTSSEESFRPHISKRKRLSSEPGTSSQPDRQKDLLKNDKPRAKGRSRSSKDSSKYVVPESSRKGEFQAVRGEDKDDPKGKQRKSGVKSDAASEEQGYGIPSEGVSARGRGRGKRGETFGRPGSSEDQTYKELGDAKSRADRARVAGVPRSEAYKTTGRPDDFVKSHEVGTKTRERDKIPKAMEGTSDISDKKRDGAAAGLGRSDGAVKPKGKSKGADREEAVGKRPGKSGGFASDEGEIPTKRSRDDEGVPGKGRLLETEKGRGRKVASGEIDKTRGKKDGIDDKDADIAGDKQKGRELHDGETRVKGRGRPGRDRTVGADKPGADEFGKRDQKGGKEPRVEDKGALDTDTDRGRKEDEQTEEECAAEMAKKRLEELDREKSISEAKPTAKGEKAKGRSGRNIVGEDKQEIRGDGKDGEFYHDAEQRAKGRGRADRERVEDAGKPGAVSAKLKDQDRAKEQAERAGRADEPPVHTRKPREIAKGLGKTDYDMEEGKPGELEEDRSSSPTKEAAVTGRDIGRGEKEAKTAGRKPGHELPIDSKRKGLKELDYVEKSADPGEDQHEKEADRKKPGGRRPVDAVKGHPRELAELDTTEKTLGKVKMPATEGEVVKGMDKLDRGRDKEEGEPSREKPGQGRQLNTGKERPKYLKELDIKDRDGSKPPTARGEAAKGSGVVDRDMDHGIKESEQSEEECAAELAKRGLEELDHERSIREAKPTAEREKAKSRPGRDIIDEGKEETRDDGKPGKVASKTKGEEGGIAPGIKAVPGKEGVDVPKTEELQKTAQKVDAPGTDASKPQKVKKRYDSDLENILITDQEDRHPHPQIFGEDTSIKDDISPTVDKKVAKETRDIVEDRKPRKSAEGKDENDISGRKLVKGESKAMQKDVWPDKKMTSDIFKDIDQAKKGLGTVSRTRPMKDDDDDRKSKKSGRIERDKRGSSGIEEKAKLRKDEIGKRSLGRNGSYISPDQARVDMKQKPGKDAKATASAASIKPLVVDQRVRRRGNIPDTKITEEAELPDTVPRPLDLDKERDSGGLEIKTYDDLPGRAEKKFIPDEKDKKSGKGRGVKKEGKDEESEQKWPVEMAKKTQDESGLPLEHGRYSDEYGRPISDLRKEIDDQSKPPKKVDAIEKHEKPRQVGEQIVPTELIKPKELVDKERTVKDDLDTQKIPYSTDIEKASGYDTLDGRPIVGPVKTDIDTTNITASVPRESDSDRKPMSARKTPKEEVLDIGKSPKGTPTEKTHTLGLDRRRPSTRSASEPELLIDEYERKHKDDREIPSKKGVQGPGITDIKRRPLDRDYRTRTDPQILADETRPIRGEVRIAPEGKIYPEDAGFRDESKKSRPLDRSKRPMETAGTSKKVRPEDDRGQTADTPADMSKKRSVDVISLQKDITWSDTEKDKEQEKAKLKKELPLEEPKPILETGQVISKTRPIKQLSGMSSEKIAIDAIKIKTEPHRALSEESEEFESAAEEIRKMKPALTISEGPQMGLKGSSEPEHKVLPEGLDFKEDDKYPAIPEIERKWPCKAKCRHPDRLEDYPEAKLSESSIEEKLIEVTLLRSSDALIEKTLEIGAPVSEEVKPDKSHLALDKKVIEKLKPSFQVSEPELQETSVENIAESKKTTSADEVAKTSSLLKTESLQKSLERSSRIEDQILQEEMGGIFPTVIQVGKKLPCKATCQQPNKEEIYPEATPKDFLPEERVIDVAMPRSSTRRLSEINRSVTDKQKSQESHFTLDQEESKEEKKDFQPPEVVLPSKSFEDNLDTSHDFEQEALPEAVDLITGEKCPIMSEMETKLACEAKCRHSDKEMVYPEATLEEKEIKIPMLSSLDRTVRKVSEFRRQETEEESPLPLGQQESAFVTSEDILSSQDLLVDLKGSSVFRPQVLSGDIDLTVSEKLSIMPEALIEHREEEMPEREPIKSHMVDPKTLIRDEVSKEETERAPGIRSPDEASIGQIEKSAEVIGLSDQVELEDDRKSTVSDDKMKSEGSDKPPKKSEELNKPGKADEYRTRWSPIRACEAKCNLAKRQEMDEDATLTNIGLEEVPLESSNLEQELEETNAGKFTETDETTSINGNAKADSKAKYKKIDPKSPSLVIKTENLDKYPDTKLPLESESQRHSIEAQEEVFLSAKDEITETKRPDHKCMAPCRNARERLTMFGEETGGVIIGMDVETPHDLIPPGYYLPEDVSPRVSIPEWAKLAHTAPVNPNNLSLSDIETITESGKVLWIVSKPEEEILEPPKGKSIPKLALEWETETEEIAGVPSEELIIPENIKSGNIISRVLSGQLIGLPPSSSQLIKRTAPQTLTEAINQRKVSSKVCKARCANKIITEDAIDEELVETAEDVSDINTDSEITNEFYEPTVLPYVYIGEHLTTEFESSTSLPGNSSLKQESESNSPDEPSQQPITEIHTSVGKDLSKLDKGNLSRSNNKNHQKLHDTESTIERNIETENSDGHDYNMEASEVIYEEVKPASQSTEQTTSLTLSEEIYQRNTPSKVCRARCANKKSDEGAVDEELVETIEDVSDINTDSENTNRFREPEILEQSTPEFRSVTSIPDTKNALIKQESISDYSDVLKLISVTEKPTSVEKRLTPAENEEEKLPRINIKDIHENNEKLQSKEQETGEALVQGKTDSGTFNVDIQEPLQPDTNGGHKIAIVQEEIYEESVTQLPIPRKLDNLQSSNMAFDASHDLKIEVNAAEVTRIGVIQHAQEFSHQDIEEEFVDASPIMDTYKTIPAPNKADINQQDISFRSNVSSEAVSLSGAVSNKYVDAFDTPNGLNTKSNVTKTSGIETIQHDEYLSHQDTEEEFLDAPTILETPPVPDTADRSQQTTSLYRTVSSEAVAPSKERTNRYVDVIERMPVPQRRESPSLFASWFSPQKAKDPQHTKEVKQKTAEASTSPEFNIRLTEKYVPIKEKSLCKCACSQDPDMTTIRQANYDEYNATIVQSNQAFPISTEPEYKKTQQSTSAAADDISNLEDNLRRLAEPPKATCLADCATGPLSKDEEIELLKTEIEAKDTYCAEQRKVAAAALEQLENIKNIVEERDDLRKKLENSQCELEELKKNLDLGFGDAEIIETKNSDTFIPVKEDNLSVTNSCDEEIETLEDEIKTMRSACLSPAQETKIIKKEVEVLKRYCTKLSSIQEENSRLKKYNEELEFRCLESEEKLQMIGCHGDPTKLADIKHKLQTLNETIAERNILQNRVKNLERELNAYQDLPEDIEVFKRRSVLLDDVLKDRDRLAKRVEQMRGIDEELLAFKQKAERVDELERQLRLAAKDVQIAEDELDSMRNKCAMAEIETLNKKTETDTLKSKIVCMEHEMESLKSMCKEQEVLQIEKERLQVSLDELVRMQDDYEHMCVQMKALDVLKAERDRYKRKYEELVGLECECNMLREQLDKARVIEREKELMERQAEDLEKCICEQEEEIRRLVSHIDCLAQGKEDQQIKMKEVVSSLKIELEKKESLLVSSEEKIATMHGKIDTSFHNLSEETLTLRKDKQMLEEKNRVLIKESKNTNLKIQKLENDMEILKAENSALKEKLNYILEENKKLQMQLKEKGRTIEIMQEVLDDRELSQSDYDTTNFNSQEIVRLQTELEAANIENQRLMLLATQANNSDTTEAHLQLKDMLAQSRNAIERIAIELEQQYAEWDCKKVYRCCPKCTCKQKAQKPEPKIIIRCCAGCTCKKKTKNVNIGNEDNQFTTGCPRKTKSESSSPRHQCQDAAQQCPEGLPDYVLCYKCKNSREIIDLKHLECKCKCLEILSALKNSKDFATEELPDGAIQVPTDFDDEVDDDQMYTARSAEETKAKILELENELLKTNDTILQLKEQHVINESLMAENTALKKHSKEVQEVAKDQIEDLVNHLKKAKDRVGELEAINCRLNYDIAEAQQQLKDLTSQAVSDPKSQHFLLTGEVVQERDHVEELLNHLKHAKNRISELEANNCQLKYDLAEAQQQLKYLSLQAVADPKPQRVPTTNESVHEKVQTEEQHDLKYDSSNAQQQFKNVSLQAVAISEIVQEEEQTEELLNQLKEARNRINELEAKNYHLTNNLAEAQRECKSLSLQAVADSTPECVQTACETVQDNDQSEELHNQLKKAKNRINELETKNCHLKYDLAEAQQQLKSFSLQAVANSKPECVQTTCEIVERKDQSEELHNQLKKAKNKINELEAKNCHLKYDLAKVRQQPKDLESKLQAQKEECQAQSLQADIPDIEIYAKLKSDLSDCLKEKQQLLVEIDVLNQKLAQTPDVELFSKLKIDLEICLKEKEGLIHQLNIQKQLDSCKAPCRGLRSLGPELDDCLRENGALLEALEESKKERENIEKLHEATLSKLKKELEKALREKEDKSCKVIQDFKKQLSDLKSQLDQCLKERQDLLSKLEILQKEVASSRLKLETALKDKEALQKITSDLKIEKDKLEKEKDALDRMLMSNVVTTSRRSSRLEDELDAVTTQNNKLLSDNHKLDKINKDLLAQNEKLLAQITGLQIDNDNLKTEISSYKDENLKLKEALKRSTADSSILETLRDENRHLKKLAEDQKEQINGLLEKLKQATVSQVDTSAWERDKKDKHAMQSTIIDLETQLRNLMNKDKDEPIKPKDDLKNKIEKLLKQLEDAQKRAEIAEDSLRKLKASDPTAMMNAEMQKLNEKIVRLEQENASLKEAVSLANNEKSRLEYELDNATKDAKKFKDENDKLRNTVVELKSEKDKTNKDLQKMKDVEFGNSSLKEENANLKKRVIQLEEEVTSLRKELDQLSSETKKISDKTSELISENSNLKKKLAQIDGEYSKAKKDLEAALLDANRATEKILGLENENAKCKQTVKDLEAEVTRLKKELDSLLNDARKGAKTISDLQNEITKLKQKISQLESVNGKIDNENTRVKRELEQALGGSQVIAALQDENNKLRQHNMGLQSQIKELEDALTDTKSKLLTATQLKDEVSALLEKLRQLETENAHLKKMLEAAKDDSKVNDLQNSYDKLRQKLAEAENENSKLKKDLQKAANDAKKINDELNILKQSEIKCKDKIAQLEVDNDKLKKNLNDTLDDLKKMGIEITNIQNEESKLKQTIALLQAENSKLKKDLEAALKKATAATEETSLLRDENSKLKQRIAQLESGNAKLKSDIDSTFDKLKQATDQIRQLQTDNNKYKQKIKDTADESEKLKQKFDAAIKEAKSAVAPDENIKKLVEDELNKLKNDLETAKKEAKYSDLKRSELKSENDLLQKKIAQLEIENAKLKSELSVALQTIKARENEMSLLQKNAQKLEDRIAQLEDGNNKLQKEKLALIGDVEKANTDLRKLAEVKDNENKLKQRIAQLETENAKLKKELDETLAEAKKLGEELSSVQNNNNKLKQAISNLENDNQKLKNDLDLARAEAERKALGVSDLKEVDDKLKQRISQLEAENTRLKSELDKTLGSSKKLVDELTKMQDKENNLKQKISRLELENAKLKKELERALSEAQAASNESADLRNEISKLKQKIPQLESEIANLKRQLEASLNDARSRALEISKLQEEKNMLKEKISQLGKDNEHLKAELEAALSESKTEAENRKHALDENNKQKQKITELENEIGKLKKELEATRLAVSQAASKSSEDGDRKKKLEQLLAENSRLNYDLNKALKESELSVSLRDEITKLKQQISKLQSDLDKAKKDLDTAITEAKKSASELAKIKENEGRLRQKVAQLETQNVKLKEELDKEKDETAEVNTLKAENKRLKDQIKQLQDEILQLKNSITATAKSTRPQTDDVQSLKDEVAKLRQNIANLQMENTTIKQQYDQAKSELQTGSSATDKLKQNNKKLETELDNLKKQLQVLKDDNQKLSNENQSLKQKVESLERDLERLKKQLTAATDELSKTKNDLDKLKQEDANLKNDYAKLKTQHGKLENDLKANKDALNNAMKKLDTFDGRDYNKQLENYQSQVKLLEAEIAKQKQECQDTISSLKAQFDRDLKNLHKKHEENIDKLQKAHESYIKDLSDKHDKEVSDLRNSINKLRQELEAAIRERDRLRNLLDDQKKKSIEIKGKVEEVEKVIFKERRRSKELEKKQSELQAVALALEQEVVRERKRSLHLQKERDDLGGKLQTTVANKKDLEAQTRTLVQEKESLEAEKQHMKEESDKLKRKSVILQKAVEEQRKKSESLEADAKLNKNLLNQEMAPILERRKLKDEKLTMTTFETIALTPEVVAITAPLSDNELAFYGKKPCPCSKSLDELLKKAAIKGFGNLSIEELQFVHKHLSEAAANILEKMGRKTGILRPTEVGDRLSLLRRIAELEGDLMRKQKHAQQKIAQMQHAVKLEKDRLTELRITLEREKKGTTSNTPRKQISKDCEALEEIKNQLEKRLGQELLNKTNLTKKLLRPEKRLNEVPVKDGHTPAVTCTARDAIPATRTCSSRTIHSTGKL